MGLVIGTADLLWVPDEMEDGKVVSSHDEEWFIPSAFECRVCRLHLNSIAEMEAANFVDRWELDEAM